MDQTIKMSSSEDWRSPEYRQTYVVKLEHWMLKYGNPTSKRGAEIEEQMFARAATKEDYLNMVARFMFHVRVLNGGHSANNANQDALSNQPAELQSQSGPSQYSLSQPIAGPPSQHQLQDQTVHQHIDTTVAMSNPNQLLQSNITISSASQNRNPGIPLSSLPGGARLVAPNQTVMSSSSQPMLFHGTATTMQQSDGTNKASLQAQGAVMAQQQLQRQQQKTQKFVGNFVSGSSAQLNNAASSANAITQQTNANQFSVPQPKGLQPPASVQQVPPTSTNKPTRSPAPYSEPSPSPVIPSSSPIPTPGSAPSPLNPEDELAYFEKIKELSKYIEPLKKIISQIPNTEAQKTNLDKMNGLLDTLTQKRRVQPAALEKSESVLAKLLSSTSQAPSSAPLTTSQTSSQVPNISSASVPTLPNKGVPQPWPEILNTLAPDPRLPIVARQINTAPLTVMNALTIAPPKPPVRKRKRQDEDVEEIRSAVPHALKVEISTLWHRFNFSCQKIPETDQSLVVLACKTKNKSLPPLPPIIVKIPTTYPKRQPEYVLHNYDSSPFLQNIKSALKSKLLRTATLQPFTNILQAWEDSIHEACAQEDLFDYIKEDRI